MTASQVRLAFTKIVQCASTSDDSLAWYCITELLSSIQAIPTSPSSRAVTLPPPAPSSATLPADSDATPPTTRLDESPSLTSLELATLKSARGHLLLTLIDQLTAVNLVLLRSLLGEIWTLVKEEKDGEAKKALGDVVFKTLGEGLDASKREEGVRWWLERGAELTV